MDDLAKHITGIITLSIVVIGVVIAVFRIQDMYIITEREETQRTCILKGGSYNDNTCFLQGRD